MSMNGVTLITRLGVTQGHWKWRRSIDHIRLSIGRHCIYSSIWYRFWATWRWKISIVTLKSGLEVAQGYSNWYHSKDWVRFRVSYSPSIVTMALFCIICEIKRDIGRKSWFFHTHLYSTPQLEESPSEYCHPIWCGIIRMVGYPTVNKFWGYV